MNYSNLNPNSRHQRNNINCQNRGSCQNQSDLGAVLRELQDANLTRSMNTDWSWLPTICSSTQTGNRQRCQMPYPSTRACEEDDRYISSYQKAFGVNTSHSYSTPLNREYNVSRSGSLPVHRFTARGSTYECPPVRDRASARHIGSWTDNRDMCSSDPFVASLRKYPLGSLERSISADLISRLLIHSHAQNCSFHTNSLRCLRRSPETSKEGMTSTKLSKNVQTYTRDRNNALTIEDDRRVSDESKKRRDETDVCGSGFEDEFAFYHYDYLKPQYVDRVETSGFQSGYSEPRCNPRISPAHAETRPPSPECTKSTDIAPDRTTTTRHTLPAQMERTSNISPVRTKATHKTSFVRTKTTPSTSPDSTKTTPTTSPVRTKNTSNTSPVRTKTTPTTSSMRSKAPETPRSTSDRRNSSAYYSPARTVRTANKPRCSPLRIDATTRCSFPLAPTESLLLSRLLPSKPEVRYLNDLTKYVSDVLRQMYTFNDDVQPQVCPRLQSRYSQHKRKCHHHRNAAAAAVTPQCHRGLESCCCSSPRQSPTIEQKTNNPYEIYTMEESTDRNRKSTTRTTSNSGNDETNNTEPSTKADWTPMEKEAFKEKAAVEMTKFINKNTGTLSAEDERKVDEAKARINSKIADIVADSILSEATKKSLIREEILKELQAMPIDSDKPLEELADSHTGTVMDIAAGAGHSTPRASFQSSSQEKDQESTLSQQREKEYLNQVVVIIDNWAECLPETEKRSDTQTSTYKEFLETLTKELAGDIVDRQKYLQLHPESKKSEADELEHLKYQTYKYLNKYFESKDVDRAICKVPSLMTALKQIKAPQMVKQSEKRCHKKLNIIRLINENLDAALTGWLKKTPMYHKKSPEEKAEQESLISELAEALHNIVVDKNYTEEEKEDQLVSETARRLKDIVKDENLKKDDIFLYKAPLLIFNYVRKHQFSERGCCSSPPPDRFLEDVVDDWIEGLQTCNRSCSRKSLANYEKKRFVASLKSLRQKHDFNSCHHERALKGVITRVIRSTADPCKSSDDCYLSHKTNQLMSRLRAVPVDIDESFAAKPFKKPTDALFEDVEKWCNDLPIHSGNDAKEQEMGQALKRNLTCKLVNKIGELNMNPEILNDEFVYEDLLKDEIDTILKDLPRNPELDKYLNPLKMELVSIVKEARQRIRDDLLGKVYKQQLRDVISTSVNISECLSPEEEASFEILKDNLANAYINLHFLTDNDEEKHKFKKKIVEEINRFSNKVLQNHSCSTLDNNRIKDLYHALRRIPVPRDESMKVEVEQARIKHVIDEWLKDLHVKNESGTALLHRNKMAMVLAKRMHEIEIEKDLNPELDGDKKMVEEAVKFLNKLSLDVRDAKIVEWAEMLKCRLKCTEKSRIFNVNHQPTTSRTSNVCIGTSGSRSTLTKDDRAHLKRIRERNSKSCSKNTSSCSLLENATSQVSVQCEKSTSQRKNANIACQTLTPTHSKDSISDVKISSKSTNTPNTDTPKPCTSRHYQRNRSPVEETSDEHLVGQSCEERVVIKSNFCDDDDLRTKCRRMTRTGVTPRYAECGISDRGVATDCCDLGPTMIGVEKGQCRCKDRVLMVCKGCKATHNKIKLYKDACSNCGNKCPYPNYYFK